MRLPTEFILLPLRFDASRLAEEVAGFEESDWRPHPQGYPGNSALSLIASGGDPTNDATAGVMRETPHLARCPYLRQVLGAFEAVLGRTRLMRLDGNAEAKAHADSNYYWVERVRIHVPIVTTPQVRFLCGDHEVNMAPGEAWLFDTWRIHNVLNPEPTRRIHLVADTVGSAEFWRQAESGEWRFAQPPRLGSPSRFVPFRPGTQEQLALEQVNQPVVMTPWELASHRERILEEAQPVVADASDRRLEGLAADLHFHEQRWRALWARHGGSEEGQGAFRALIDETARRLVPHDGALVMENGIDACEAVRQWMLRPALNPHLGSNLDSRRAGVVPVASRAGPAPAGRRRDAPRRFDRPVFLVSPPRSGSSLLFETVAQSPAAWTVGGESHALIEGLKVLHPSRRGFSSNRLEAADASPAVVERLTDAFFLKLRDRDGERPAAGAQDLRLVEKTPKNALRVPFLAAAFPDALFVYLYRNPRETLHSMLEAWESGRFVTYPRLPGWTGAKAWSLALTPGWRDLVGFSLPEIVAQQWSAITEALVNDLDALPAERWCVANYGALVSQPQEEILRLCRFLDLPWDRRLESPLPLSRHTVTPPEPGKWRRRRDALDPVFPLVRASSERALELFARRPGHAPLAGFEEEDEEETQVASPPLPVPERGRPRGAAPTARDVAVVPPSPLRSVHTPSFAELLAKLGSSLVVTTYQSGRVVLVRAQDGAVNTQFSSFPSPMGLAVGPRYLALGTAQHVWEFRNVPGVAKRLAAAGHAGEHDAVYLPRRQHLTGDLRVHEMAFAGDELWIVNTRFSCLCSLDAEHSFVPRWRPPFVSTLAAEDRCHLNGMAVVEDRARYVTAFGRTDTAGGWRDGKANGGLVLDVPSGEPVATGLSMPHSPRWHQGRLWVLESGKGELNVIDLASGASHTVVQLPGFTRGLAFAGPFAFVGLSQVRESVFGGIPLGERLEERVSGVWAVDTRTGQVAGFLRFEDAVQEIFDVQLLPGVRFPHLADLTQGELIGTTFVLPPSALRESASC